MNELSGNFNKYFDLITNLLVEALYQSLCNILVHLTVDVYAPTLVLGSLELKGVDVLNFPQLNGIRFLVTGFVCHTLIFWIFIPIVELSILVPWIFKIQIYINENKSESV